MASRNSLLKKVKDITRQFFHLPLEEKLKIKLSADTAHRGYQKVGDNITKGVPDMQEAIDCYRELKHDLYGDLGKPMEGPNLWLDNPQNFKSVMEQYIALCTELSRKIMRGIALALGGSKYELEGKTAGDPFWVMRLIGYPVVTKANGDSKPENDIGCGAHTDYGLLTLVNQDEDITALQILTNGLYESTVHRVINDSPKYRVCIAYFYETNFDAAIEPLEICVHKTGGIKKLERVVYGEHLVGKVKTNFRY